MDAPKYGNDDEKADFPVGEIFTYITDRFETYDTKLGKMTTGMLPVSGNTPIGAWVGAPSVGALCVDIFDRWNRSHGRYRRKWAHGTSGSLSAIFRTHGSHRDAAEYEAGTGDSEG